MSYQETGLCNTACTHCPHRDWVSIGAKTKPINVAICQSHLYNKRRYVCLFVCLFVCLYLCSVWPAKRLGQSTPNLTHALMSTQGVFLSRSMSRSFMYACGSDRITKRPARCAKATPGERCSNYVRRTGEATPGERLWNSVRTMDNYSSSNEARRRRRRAASAEGASRTPSGGRVITASTW